MSYRNQSTARRMIGRAMFTAAMLASLIAGASLGLLTVQALGLNHAHAAELTATVPASADRAV